MASLASARELFQAFSFRVVVARFGVTIPFAKCGPLRCTASYSTFKEAGARLPIKDPESIEFDNLTLERGAARDFHLYDWMRDVWEVSDGLDQGLPVPQVHKSDVIIYQLDRAGRVLKKFFLTDAFPVEFVASDWDNNADAIVIERLTLAYDHFTTDVARTRPIGPLFGSELLERPPV